MTNLEDSVLDIPEPVEDIPLGRSDAPGDTKNVPESDSTREDNSVAKEASTDVPRHHVVGDGDSLESLSERYGVPVDELVRRNDRVLANSSQARGLPTHTYRREVRDASGGSRFETGYHVHTGDQLELRDPVEGEPGYQR